MTVPATMGDLSPTIASNSPAGSEALSSTDDYVRALSGIIRRISAIGGDIASSGSITPDTFASVYAVTGTNTITSILTTGSWTGRIVTLVFAGACTLAHNGSTLILPGAANIVAASGDVGQFIAIGTNAWRCITYQRASGVSVGASIAVEAKDSSNLSSAGYFTVYTEVLDTASAFSGGIFTAPFGGTYFVLATVAGSTSSGSGQAICAIVKSGVDTNTIPVQLSPDFSSSTRGYVGQLAVNDTIRIRLASISGAGGVANVTGLQIVAV